jgi:arylsulfatase A-like enzyme
MTATRFPAAMTAGAASAILLLTALGHAAEQPAVAQAQPPNIVLIVSDDQGYGDLGVHGNPKLTTPHIDRLARDGVRFTSFYVSPVCSPTRASLLTGRYNYRTGVVDTYLGRSMMHPDETTLAEFLLKSGYRTGIFGKWHLGDNYPLRAMDQGFQESLVLNGGGIGQPSDPVGGESYFDPMLRRNGDWVRTEGYVTDVITDAAIEFIRRSRLEPFFAYVAFNAPHTPLEVPPGKHAKYREMKLQRTDFPDRGVTISATFDPDVTAKIYGMVENIDENVGRLLAALDELRLTERTVVIFMTDNGPQQPRYNAGLPGLKGTVHEGGIRVPFFVRWPGTLTPRASDRIAAHIDVTPTLLDIAGASEARGGAFDGRSLLPLLRSESNDWPDRTLFFQWHRGDAPQKYRAFAARNQRYKLMQPQGSGTNPLPDNLAFRLYDIANDPFEQTDLSKAHPEIVSGLKADYERWFDMVTGTRDYADGGIARINVGSPRENPVRLTRQDWRGPEAAWSPKGLGHWEVAVSAPGSYDVTVRFAELREPGTVRLAINGRRAERPVAAGATTVSFPGLRLPAGAARLESWVTQGSQRIGMLDVVIANRGAN